MESKNTIKNTEGGSMSKEIYIGREELADGTILQEAAFSIVDAANDYLKKCMGRNWYEGAKVVKHGNGFTCEKVVKREIYGKLGRYEIAELECRELTLTAIELDGTF
jgi:hypothetical protein